MQINTTRFGSVKIEENDTIAFEEGIVGFNSLKKFVLLDDPNDEIFAWLQSCEASDIAFPVLEPELFAANYKFNLTKNDLEALRLQKNESLVTFCIVTIPEDPTQMTANMKAPVVINKQLRLGRQCVLQDNNLAIREPIFSLLQQRVVQNPDKTIKAQFTQLPNVSVRLEAEI